MASNQPVVAYGVVQDEARPAPARPSLVWVNHFAIAPEHSGGTRHFELGRELVRRGWAVSVVASDFHLQSRRYTRRRDASDRQVYRECIDGVEFFWLWAAPYQRNDWRRVWNWLTFGRSLLAWQRGRRRPDVVIGSSPHLFAALGAERVAAGWSVPFVFEVRDLWPEGLLAGGRRKGVGYHAFGLIARHLYRRANRVIVVSEGAGQYLAAGTVPRAKIAHVPNGVDVSRFGPRVARSRGREFRAIYTGAHGPLNGLNVVLEAADRLRYHSDIRFVLVGDGPSKPELMAAADRMQLRNVTFRDPISSRDIPDLLAEADAGLMVLREAPLFAFAVSPNKLFDYLAAGLPVVNNVPGELAAMLADSGAGEQAANGSAEALAEAVLRLAALPEAERSRKGAAGREWVRHQHGREYLGGELDRLLRELVKT